MKVTQVKIAEKAKVAQSTVSRVLGGHATDIAPETRHAVLKAAKSLGYSPTVEKTGNIGFIVGGSDVSDFVADPYTHRFFKGVQDYTEEKDYDFFMRSLPENEDLPGVLRKQKVDGLVVSIPLDERRVERISSIVPVVSLNYELKGGNVDSVMPDNRSGIKKVVNYLHRKGHRNIAVFALKPYSMHFTERYSGYLEAIREIGLPEREDYVRFPYRQEGRVLQN